jgi:PAS domain S-box-containing protein
VPRALIVYGGSVGALAAAVMLRWLLTPLMGDTLPLVTLFGAVAFAVWLGGYRPALLVVVAGYLACSFLFIRPRSDPSDITNLVGLVAYLATCSIIIIFGDIMRAAQRSAEVRREFLRVTIASVGDAVITTDTNGLVSSLNASAEALTGWTDRDARGTPIESVFRMVNEENRATVESPVATVLKTGAVVGLANHTVLIARDGTERTIDDRAAPIRDAEGRIVGCVLVFRDVSERRRAEAALRENEERFRLVVESAKDYAIITLDATGTVTSWNSGARNVLGYDEQEMVGRNIRLVFETDDVELGIPEIELHEALSEGRTTHERWHVRKDGSRFWASGSTLRLQRAGGAVGFVKIMRDTTPTKRAAEELQASERRLAVEAAGMKRLHELVSRLLRCSDLTTAMQEVLDATVSLVGADMGNVQLLNPQTGQLDMVAHRGLKHQLLDHFRDVSANVGTACQRTLQTRERVLVEDVERDLRYRPYLPTVRAAGYRAVQSTPVLGRTGKLLGILSTHYRKPHRPAARDLRMLDLYARQAADFIERMLVDQALRDADRQKDEFLATLSHELRNPLAPVRNSLEVMKRANGNSGLIEQARSTLERQIAQMVRLIDDLLDVSRITRNRLELRRERIDLGTVVQHAIEANRPLFDAAHHELEVVLPVQPIHLNADPMRLAQVFGNLLTNAGKYTRPGGHVSLVAEHDDAVVRVTVKDNGIGIPAETLPRVFDLFTQVDRTLERAGGGLGIGLSLVKRLVEMHDGMVTAYSAGKDRGSEFVVRLPIRTDPPKEEPVEEMSTQVESGGRRILVVDDNRDAAVSLAMLLKVTGNDTQTAYDGLEAIEKAAAYKPDVILLDIGLPKLNGYDACRAIREQPWGKHIMMVALTGWGQDEDRRKSSEAGFDTHLVKPVDHAVLAKLLGEHTPA